MKVKALSTVNKSRLVFVASFIFVGLSLLPSFDTWKTYHPVSFLVAWLFLSAVTSVPVLAVISGIRFFRKRGIKDAA